MHTLVFCPMPKETKVDYGSNMRTVRATSTGIVRFEPVGDMQCKVTAVQHGTFGGVVPDWVARSKIPVALRGIATLRDEFQRDEAIDSAERAVVEDAIKTQLDALQTAEEGGNEMDMVPRVVVKLDALKNKSGRVLEHPDLSVKLEKYAMSNDDDIMTEIGDGELVAGNANAVIDASLERCSGWAFAEAARIRTKDGDASHRVRCDVRSEEGQSQIVDTAYTLPGGKLLTCTWASEGLREKS
jgi:hypothetical protein